MAFRSSQPSRDTHTYIPASMQQAISKHVDQSMPAHLKPYQQSGGQMPTHIQKAMTKHMEQTLPPHMRQYATPYMEQAVLNKDFRQPVVAPTAGSVSAPQPSSVPNFMAIGSPTAQTQVYSPVSQQQFQQPPVPQEQLYPAQPALINQAQTGGYASDYDFIMNPQNAAPPKAPLLPGGNSTAGRLAVVTGGALLLIFGFVLVRSFLLSGPNLVSYVGVAQEQQALVHLADNAMEEPDISTSNKNFAATVKLAVTSSQSGLLAYLQTNSQAVKPEELQIKISSTTDQQLADASAAGTYNATFQDIMKTKLQEYQTKLDQAYGEATGETGRDLLMKDYKQVDLMLNQLNSAAIAPQE